MIIGYQNGLRHTMQQVALVAQTDSTALILGETGSGKEVIARYLHQHSGRSGQSFVRVNCGAIPSELIDSELFGHEKGSFTGATALKRGWFERANGGTLFLDEIGELSLAAQVRLLRVVQEGTLCRVGGEKEIAVNVRIIAATHKDLEQAVKQGVFRQDLWFRINVFPIKLPALSERLGDIQELAEYFAHNASKKLGLPLCLPTSEQINYLQQYTWPGNVRELQVVIERAAILGQGTSLQIEASLPLPVPVMQTREPQANPASPVQATTGTHFQTLAEMNRLHISKALAHCQGRIDGPFGAARLLDINPNTLRSKMRKLGIIRYSAAQVPD